jgi:uncharacterized delta-60 repeat protein
MGKLSVSLAAVTMLWLRAVAAPGDVDVSFDAGTLVTNLSVLSVAVQPDDKVLVAPLLPLSNGFYIGRLNTNGTLDGSFNPGTAINSQIESIAIQADGKVLVGGKFTSINGTNRNRIARLNSDGAFDATFNPGTGANGEVHSVVQLSDGKILVAGYFTSINDTNRNRIARLNADGSLDTTFNPGSGADFYIYRTAVQSDGKILIVGGFSTVNGTNCNAIARLNSNGALDTGFNPGANAGSYMLALAVQPDGRVLIGGEFTSISGTNRTRLARLNSNGTLDASFNPGTGANGEVEDLAVQSDGRILVGGSFTSINGTNRNYVARLNSDGSPDTSFTPSANSRVQTIAFAASGKAIIGGNFTNINSISRSRIARLLGDPRLTIIRTGGNVTVSWPTNAGNFTLQSATNLLPPVDWIDFTNTAAILGTEFTVTNTASESSEFYRLKK